MDNLSEQCSAAQTVVAGDSQSAATPVGRRRAADIPGNGHKVRFDEGFNFDTLEQENFEACRALVRTLQNPGPLHDAGLPKVVVKRMLTEMVQWTANTQKNGWYTFTPIDRTRLDNFLGTICGPAETPWEGGIFHIRIDIPKTYPYLPPKMWFLTRILHPNIDQKGEIFVNLLLSEERGGIPPAWTPLLTMEKLLISVASMLSEPNWDDIVDDLPWNCLTSREHFEDQARIWTQKYATGMIVYPGERDDGFYTVAQSIPGH